MNKNILIPVLAFILIIIGVELDLKQGNESTFKAYSQGIFSKEKPGFYNKGVKLDKALKGDKPVIVMFYTDWCGYCHKAAPIFDMMRSMYDSKAAFVMVDGDRNKQLTEDYGIRYYPTTFLMYPDGKPFVQMGPEMLNHKKYQEKLETLLEDY